MQRKEEWIKTTLDSLDNIRRAKANTRLYEQIQERLASLQESRIISIRPAMVWRVAASVILLIGLNVFTAVHFNKVRNSSQSKSQAFSQDYFSYVNSEIISE